VGDIEFILLGCFRSSQFNKSGNLVEIKSAFNIESGLAVQCGVIALDKNSSCISIVRYSNSANLRLGLEGREIELYKIVLSVCGDIMPYTSELTRFGLG